MGNRYDKDGHIQTIPTELLAAAARGDVDLNQMAREELANRGLNEHGKWVGFDKAKRIHESFKTYRKDGRAVRVTVPTK